jgi:hypothetical protein
MFLLIGLVFSVVKGPKKSKVEGNILYVTEQNMTIAFEDLPAVFLLVQLGSDRDGRFRTRADFLSAAPSLGSRCFFALMDGDRNSKFVRSINQKEARAFLFYRYGELVGRYFGRSRTEAIIAFTMSRTGIPFTTFDDFSVAGTSSSRTMAPLSSTWTGWAALFSTSRPGLRAACATTPASTCVLTRSWRANWV